MKNYKKEEEYLREKLKNLEQRYKEGVFSGEGAEEKIKEQIGNISEEIEEDRNDKAEEEVRKQEKIIKEEKKRKKERKSKEENERKKGKIRKEEKENKERKKKEIPIRKIRKQNIIEQSEKPGKNIFFSKNQRPDEYDIKKISEKIKILKQEIAKVIIGQEEIVNGLILGLICNAHVLVEGVPGIAKTLAIKALASASGCDVKRVQFTVDMLPTDIIGITSYTPEKGFEVIKGPIFANFLIADEINRSPPKTQSALIEAMQEKQVTIGKEKFFLPPPFFVMATENPIENAGVYPLPEAQIDRFLFKLIMGYPKEDEERKIMEYNTTLEKFENFELKAVISPKEIIEMQELVKRVYLNDNIKSYILSIVRKTRERDFENSQYISYGSSPRASIGLFIASKGRALMEGRNFVLPEDVKKVVLDVMRHRLILSYKASINKISPDSIIQEILNSIKVY